MGPQDPSCPTRPLSMTNGDVNGGSQYRLDVHTAQPPVQDGTVTPTAAATASPKTIHPMALPNDRRDIRESSNTPQGTPHVIKRGSSAGTGGSGGGITNGPLPDNPDDLAAHQRLQAVTAPHVEALKHAKSIQKICAEQDKDLKKLRGKYEKNMKRLESVHTEERGRVILERDKTRTRQERRKGKVLGETRDAGSANELDGPVRAQEGQWWELVKRQADATAALRQEHYKKELDINLRYHEHFYRQLEAELNQQQVVINERLRSANKLNVEEIKTKLSQQASRELAELKTQRDLDKSQLEQRRDDVTQKNIRQGVAIAKKYEVLYEDRRKVLTEVSLLTVDWLTDQSLDCLMDLLNDCLIVCLIAWLFVWLLDWLFDCLIVGLTENLIDWSSGLFFSSAHSVDWLVVWLVFDSHFPREFKSLRTILNENKYWNRK